MFTVYAKKKSIISVTLLYDVTQPQVRVSAAVVT